MTTAYVTILSTNYLPKALALAASLRRHEDGARLKIFFIDHAHDDTLPELDGVECFSTAVLGLSDRTVLDLVMGYDLVEFATAIKPLLFTRLLDHHDEVVYLDPDTFLLTPLVELPGALAATEGGILLTPHFLHPAPAGADIADGHMLAVGVYNLGFCALDQRSRGFLDWWWGHLLDECLFDPLSGLFVDQKWVDLGSTLFRAGAFRHSGYNVGVANLSERPVGIDDDGYYNAANGERLRLFHFHAFDSSAPDKLSIRFRHTTDNPLEVESAVRSLCKQYAEILIGFEQTLPPLAPYPYRNDTKGRHINRQLRRAHRIARQGGASAPSPFIEAEAGEYDRWRRSAWRTIARALAGDVAKCLRIVLPEEYDRIKARFPKVARKMNDRFGGGTGAWG